MGLTAGAGKGIQLGTAAKIMQQDFAKTLSSLAAEESSVTTVTGISNKCMAIVPKTTKLLGEWGETRLTQILEGRGYKPTKYFNTSFGRRLPDRIVGGVIHEAKAGLNAKLNDRIRSQVLADAELVATGKFEEAHWHFFQGASPNLLKFLLNNGIRYTLH